MPRRGKERIAFNEAWRTFSLYPGKSLYAFCITPEGSLEHLYWGQELEEGYDLRYLSQSARLVPHDTVEEILAIKKNSRSMLFEDQALSESDMDPRNKVRYDNLKWRTQAMGSKSKLPVEGLAGLDLNAMSSSRSADGSSNGRSGSPRGGGVTGRNRASSTPLQMRPSSGMPSSDSMSDVLPLDSSSIKRSSSGATFDFAHRRAPVDERGDNIETRAARSGSVNVSAGTINSPLSFCAMVRSNKRPSSVVRDTRGMST